jgi:hypothetical protein
MPLTLYLYIGYIYSGLSKALLWCARILTKEDDKKIKQQAMNLMKDIQRSKIELLSDYGGNIYKIEKNYSFLLLIYKIQLLVDIPMV